MSEAARRPRLAFRLGVAGPRDLPPAAREALRPRIDRLLASIEASAAATNKDPQALHDTTQPPLLRLITPLAEGADQLVAEVALARNWRIEAVLPFAAEEYRQDFAHPATPGTTPAECLAAFDELLAAAGSNVLALDGDRTAAARSYEAAGRTVVRNCDLLLAIWDGTATDGADPGQGKRGGTAETVRFAARYGPPVWWLRADGSADPVVLLDTPDLRRRAAPQEAADPQAWLGPYLARSFTCPAATPPHPHSIVERIAARCHRGGQRDELRELLAQPPRTDAIFLDGVHARVLNRLRRGWKERAQPAPAPLDKVATAEWLTDDKERIWPQQSGEAAAHWQRAYKAPDRLSEASGRTYRSGYLLASMAIGLALALAVLGLAVPALKTEATALELLVLLLLYAVVQASAIWRVHQRWLLYRLVAELCRKQEHLAALGWALPLHRVDRAAEAAGAPQRWIGWYFNALAREAPLPTGRFDKARLGAIRDVVRDGLVMGQVYYHGRNLARSIVPAERLLRWGERLFLATVVIVMLKLGVMLLAPKGALGGLVVALGLLAALLPVLSAASFVLRAYMELNLVAEGSRAMLVELADAADALDSLDLAKPLASQELAAETYALAATMLADVEGWARLFRVKVIEPG